MRVLHCRLLVQLALITVSPLQAQARRYPANADRSSGDMPDQGFKNYLPADLPRKYHPTEVLPSQRKSSGGSKSLLPVKLTVTARVSFRVNASAEPHWSIYERQIQRARLQLQHQLFISSGLGSRRGYANGSMYLPPTAREASRIAVFLASSPGVELRAERWSPADADTTEGQVTAAGDPHSPPADHAASSEDEHSSQHGTGPEEHDFWEAVESAGPVTDSQHAATPGAAGNSDVAAADQQPLSPAPPARGILIAAGGTVLLTHVYVMLTVLRKKLGCHLPVQIVYNRGHEMDEPSQDILEGQFADVKVVDAAYLNYPKHHQLVNVEHHVIKAYAFYHCPFDQVLVLDADNLPLMDPTPLFNSDGFKEHGSMFWPGFDHDVPRKAYQLFRLQPPRGPGSEEIKSTEAGQFLFDRRMHADVVEWVWFLNAYGPDGVYKYTQTDTDTYQLAFSLAGKAAHFHQVDQRPRAMLCHIKPEHQDDKRFMHTGVLHHTPDGQPLFAHRLGEGKLSPLADWECMGMHYVSVPLNPERAALLYAPNRYLRSYADEVGALVDATTPRKTLKAERRQAEKGGGQASRCGQSSPLRFHNDCGFDPEGSSMPVPLFKMEQFEQDTMRGVIRKAARTYDSIRDPIRRGDMFGHVCSSYTMQNGVECPNVEMLAAVRRRNH